MWAAALSLGMAKGRGLFWEMKWYGWQVWGWSLQHCRRARQEDPCGGVTLCVPCGSRDIKGEKRRNRNGQMTKRRDTNTASVSVRARPAGFVSPSWSLPAYSSPTATARTVEHRMGSESMPSILRRAPSLLPTEPQTHLPPPKRKKKD